MPLGREGQKMPGSPPRAVDNDLAPNRAWIFWLGVVCGPAAAADPETTAVCDQLRVR
jgi:hypothetical protein